MPMCIECKTVVGVGELNAEKICKKCASPENAEARANLAKMNDDFAKGKSDVYSKSDAELALLLRHTMITTETVIDIPIEKRIKVIFSEYVYGLNVIKDFFAGIRNFVGGRVGSIEEPMRDTNQKIIKEMKMKAIELGGNAVIGLKLDYHVGGGFASVFAVGTVVKLVDKEGV